MATYHIYISNKSGAVRTYMLFCELPKIAGGSQTIPYSNVYAVGRPRLGDGSIQQFSSTSDAYACCGYQIITRNAIISGADNTEVLLEGNKENVANMVVIDGGPGFVKTSAGADAGSFEITIPPYDSNLYPDIWCGYGKQSAMGDIPMMAIVANMPSMPVMPMLAAPNAAPGVKVVSSWQASPNSTYIVTPVVKFYISTGAYVSGQAVNLKEIGAKALIDFTNQGENVYAYVEENSRGEYSEVKYTPNPPTA